MRLRESIAAAEAAHAEREKALAAALARAHAERDAVIAKAEELARTLARLQNAASRPATQRVVDPDAAPLLPLFASGEAAPSTPEVEVEAPPDAPRGERGGGGKVARRRDRSAYDHLPARTIRCPADPAATCAGCGGPLRVIGTASSFRVEWVPGHFEALDLVRDKCAYPQCPDEGVLTVPAPCALDKAVCGDSLLARVLVDKFADHVPLHRRAGRMGREGFEVGTRTLSAWVVAAAGLLRLLAEQVRREVLANAFVQGDDTGFPIQDGGDGALCKGRLWAFTDQDQAFYAFTATKAGHVPVELLDGFDGDCLVADGGSEFNAVVRAQDLHRAGCWSHLRTHFHRALDDHPREAGTAIATVRSLFLLERRWHGAPPEERLALRREHAAPHVEALFDWLRALSGPTRPTSALGKAVAYALRQEGPLRLFLERGDVPMHNNLSELLLRQPVVGRKNWLFARSEGGALAAATLFTLIGSCFLQGVDPHRYLTHVLQHVGDHPASRLDELTPRSWAERLRHVGAGA